MTLKGCEPKPASETVRRRLETIYKHLEIHFGPTGWWPADSPFEMAVGAILTQNTAWSNVEKAINNLKAANCLDVESLLALSDEDLGELIRPSGFFRQKAERIRRFCQYLQAEYQGDMAQMAQTPAAALREELLALNGIGPETADDILLYACGAPVFVVDAYTQRIFSRHGLVPEKTDYATLQQFFHHHLGKNLDIYKEFHGLIVWTGKYYCRKQPQCEGCPLQPLLQPGQPILSSS